MEFFTLTMHWVHHHVEQNGRVTWQLRRRVLASVAVHEETIDQAGEACAGAASSSCGVRCVVHL